MKLSKGIQFFAGSTQTTYDLTNLNLSAGNYAITVVAEAEGFTDSDVSNSVNYTVQAQLAAPTIAMNADGKTLEITDVADATSYDVYVDGTMKTNVAGAPNTTTVDLSTLSDIADGSHTVKVKAKASGYNDSEFSNEVNYTKAPAGYSGTIKMNVLTKRMNISGYDSQGVVHTIQNQASESVRVSGYVQYYVYPDGGTNNSSVVTSTNCTYSYLNSGYLVTPTNNGFRFVIK